MCSYWDPSAEKWQIAGLSMIGVVNSSDSIDSLRVGCASVHLTSFAISSSSIGVR